MQTASSGLLGLSTEEVQRKRASGEGNSAPAPSGRTYWQIVRENVFTFINVCLFGLGFTLVLLGRPMDALISTGVILLNVSVSVVQEVRAKRVLDRIALITRATATVLRDGVAREVAPQELVIGDLLKVAPGDQFVLDGRMVAGAAAVDESLLTGESDLMEKREGDQVFSGTFCAVGSAYYRAESAGSASLASHITRGAKAFRRVLTPLQREIHRVIRIALFLVLYCEFLLLLRSLFQHTDLVTSVQNSTIVASLVPNGLFLSIAVAYALAAVRMVRVGALVQQANAVESLSRVDLLCLDKTGTLTTNRLVLTATESAALPEAEFRRLLGAFAANTSAPTKTSEAIATACPGRAMSVQFEIPFSSERKWSALVFDGIEDASAKGSPVLRGLYALGAPDILAPLLDERDAGEEWAPRTLAARVGALAGQGLRVLLLARGADSVRLDPSDPSPTLPSGLVPLGLAILRDELRAEAGATLAAFAGVGVEPKIISGDHPAAVAALARSAGLSVAEEAVSGVDLARLDAQEFRETARASTIFGRITPEQKARLIQVFREDGHHVAMIGDGVNDVLPLKQADVAIAMRTGSQAARSVADLVLMEDSFAPLLPAVVEGQRILNGMRSILQLFLTRIGTVGIIIFSSLIIGEFPLALRHGSLVTLFSVGLPTVLLALWARPGVSPKGSFVRQLLHFVLPPVIVTTVLALTLLYGTTIVELQFSGALARGISPVQSLAINASIRGSAQSTLAVFLVFVGLLLVIFVEPPTPWWVGGNPLSGDRRPTQLAVALMVVFVAVLEIPPLRNLFALSPLNLRQTGLVAVALLVWLFAVRGFWRLHLLSRLLGDFAATPTAGDATVRKSHTVVSHRDRAERSREDGVPRM
jgi:cation-transporting P-type ATPase E